MSSPSLSSLELTQPTPLRWLSYYFLWFAHVFEPMPILRPLSLAAFIITHLDVLSLPRKWSIEMVLAVLGGLYVVALLFIHRTIFDVSLGEFAASARIPYALFVFLMFACCDSRLALEQAMLRTGWLVAGVYSLVSLYFYFLHPESTFFEGRQFEMGTTLTGLAWNHNTIASYFGSVLVGAFVWWLHKRTFVGRERAIPEILLLPGIALAFLMTKSRSFSVGLLSVGLYAGFIRGSSPFIVRFFTVVLVMGGILVGSLVIGTRDQVQSEENIDRRLLWYREAAERIPLSPFIGLGVGSYAERNVKYSVQIPWLITLRSTGERFGEEKRNSDIGHVHNLYLQTMLDVGLLGVVLLSTFFLAGVKRSRRIKKLAQLSWGEDEVLERASLNADLFLGSLVFLMVSGFFTSYTVFGTPCILLLYASLGRLVALSRTIEDAEIETEIDLQPGALDSYAATP